MQIATNTLNEYGDYRHAVDTSPSPGFAGLIVSGEVSARQILLTSLVCYALAFLLGIALVFERGTLMFVLGGTAILAGALYSEGPIPISSTPAGEVLVAIIMGPIENRRGEFGRFRSNLEHGAGLFDTGESDGCVYSFDEQYPRLGEGQRPWTTDSSSANWKEEKPSTLVRADDAHFCLVPSCGNYFLTANFRFPIVDRIPRDVVEFLTLDRRKQSMATVCGHRFQGPLARRRVAHTLYPFSLLRR